MGVTPKDVQAAIKKAPQPKLSPAFEQGRHLGKQEGEDAVRNEVLTFLQERYLDDKVERGTPEAKAILQLAGDVAQFLREKLGR